MGAVTVTKCVVCDSRDDPEMRPELAAIAAIAASKTFGVEIVIAKLCTDHRNIVEGALQEWSVVTTTGGDA